jgi:xanthine dehydrogenase accessory factor
MNWAAYALDLISRSEPAAMATIVDVAGSAPRDAGTRMIVSEHAIFGTVGGGNLELHMIDQARRLMTLDGMSVLQQDYPLGPLLAQCCGGRVRMLIEQLDASSSAWLATADQAERDGVRYTLEGTVTNGAIKRTVDAEWPERASEGARIFSQWGVQAGQKEAWSRIVECIAPVATPLYLLGAGHVGRAIAHIATTLPFRFHWYDSRAEAAAYPGVTLLEDLSPVVANAPRHSFFLVVTHAHELDYSLVRAILSRGDQAFCGLIGSATKRARFLSRLAKDGVDAAGLTCPIGAGMIRSKAPASIAVGVAAELLMLLEARAEHDLQSFASPNPPPPGVSITNASPAATSALAVGPSSIISPFARRR